jgi:hypothetical protein
MAFSFIKLIEEQIDCIDQLVGRTNILYLPEAISVHNLVLLLLSSPKFYDHGTETVEDGSNRLSKCCYILINTQSMGQASKLTNELVFEDIFSLGNQPRSW